MANSSTRTLVSSLSTSKHHIIGVYTTSHVSSYSTTVALTGKHTGGGSHNFSIYASGRIACSELNVHCDERIKEVMGVSDINEDLNTLLQIQVTDYSYKDPVIHGNQLQKKVLGQQIAKVYPQQ